MEYFVTQDGKYRIESLTPATVSGILRVTNVALIPDENMMTGSGVNKDPKAFEYITELLADMMLDGVSLVAVAVDTGDVVAVLINQIAHKAERMKIYSEERPVEDSLKSLMKYVADTEDKSNVFEIYKVDCCFELFALGTLREHRNKKLATLLWKYSLEVARKIKDGSVVPIRVADLGPKYSHLRDHGPVNKYPEVCSALCSVIYTQKIAKNFGFNLHLTVPMSEFEYNGITYSERIGDENACCQKFALRL